MTNFLQMGFSSSVTETVNVSAMGYIATYNGNPYNVHPSATLPQWQALQEAITAGTVTVVPYSPPTASELLAQAQATQIATLQAAYKAAVNAPVTYKNAAGVTSTYPSGGAVALNGQTAQQNLEAVIVAGSAAWTLGKWLDTNSVAQTFTYADLQGLAAAMSAAVTLDWQDLVAAVAKVQAATTVAEVQAITW